IDFSSYARGWVGLDFSFGRFFWNSLVISLLVVTGNVISCSLTAFAFSRLRFAGRNFWFAIMLGTTSGRMVLTQPRSRKSTYCG
ncbi:hypothetical protein ACCS64_39000, partial [Rhizobium ruizarguesonis]